MQTKYMQRASSFVYGTPSSGGYAREAYRGVSARIPVSRRIGYGYGNLVAVSVIRRLPLPCFCQSVREDPEVATPLTPQVADSNHCNPSSKQASSALFSLPFFTRESQ